MNKPFYRLVAKHACENDFLAFEKGDEVYTHHPENYGKEDFDWFPWDIHRKFETPQSTNRKEKPSP